MVSISPLVNGDPTANSDSSTPGTFNAAPDDTQKALAIPRAQALVAPSDTPK
jgi:hypothetical protein